MWLLRRFAALRGDFRLPSCFAARVCACSAHAPPWRLQHVRLFQRVRVRSGCSVWTYMVLASCAPSGTCSVVLCVALAERAQMHGDWLRHAIRGHLQCACEVMLAAHVHASHLKCMCLQQACSVCSLIAACQRVCQCGACSARMRAGFAVLGCAWRALAAGAFAWRLQRVQCV